jgi:hypothetical protein
MKEVRLLPESTCVHWSNASAIFSHSEHNKKDLNASTATLKQ